VKTRGWPTSGLLLALALFVRLLPARYVWLPDRVLFFDADSFYHMRRIFYTLAHFPASLEFDLYINHPEGARPIWSPLFDWLIAASIWPFRDHLDERGVEVWATWVPPLVGALAVVALHRVTRPRFGEGVAALAAGVLALLPAHAWYSQVGYVDHHSAVALMAIGLLAAGFRFIESQRFAVPGFGCALGLSLLLWPGLLLEVAVVELAVVGAIGASGGRAQAIAGARRFALAQFIALALVAPSGLTSQWPQWSDASPVVLSHFQPWLFATAGGAALAASGLWTKRPRTGERPAARIASALALGLAMAAISTALWPGLFAGFVESWQWIARTDSFQHLVGESRPLLVDGDGRFNLLPGTNNLSAFLLVAPIALGFGVHAAFRSPRPAVLGLVLAFAVVSIAAALIQRRFANTASIGVALLFALSVRALYDVVRRRTTRRSIRAIAALALAGATAGALAPGLLGFRPEIEALFDRRGGVSLHGQRYEWYALYDTALWLRENTPPTAGWLDTDGSPAYGIVGAWDVGHMIQYVGRRPTSTNNFGDDIGERNFLLVQDYFGGDESAGVAILDRLGARYVVVPHYAEFLATPPGPRSMYRSLYERDGRDSIDPGEALAGEVLAAEEPKHVGPLAHHRLVYQHVRTARGAAERPPYKVFEYVAGARVAGRASPGATIRAEIEVQPLGGREFEYVATAVADSAGRYELVLPYATGDRQSAVRTGETYQFGCGDGSAPLRVGEAAVRQGRTLRGPDPCPASGT
jgi:asparagine N-glycosylation enzyme membrane subunit Stt3